MATKKVKPVQSPIKPGLKSKEDIVNSWLPRYTSRPLGEFGEYILLTNFSNYVRLFSEMHDNAPIMGLDKPMQSVTAGGITIINFGMGSPMAATIMDLLSAIAPKAVLFLGKAGGLKKKNKIGDLVLPIAAIRGEGTSNDYFPPEVPALPAFALQKAISTTIRDHSRKFPPFLHLRCRRPSLQPYGIIHLIIGREPSIRRIDGYGNTIKSLNGISSAYGPCW